MILETILLVCFLNSIPGTTAKSIQNETIDNRVTTLEKLVAKFEIKMDNVTNNSEKESKKRVAFYAKLTSTRTLNSYSIIKFDNVVLNDGDHYNSGDGVFVAPISGVYLFSWTTLTYNGNNAFTELRVENVVKGIIASSAPSSVYIPASKSLVCQVRNGDHVWVQTSSVSANYLYDWNDPSSFMGVLLYME